jgi:predicted transposase/invertase (TIGR01784 family)
MRFINPKTDFAFNRIFVSSGSKNIRKSFLNALIYEGQAIIEDIEILDPALASKIPGLKDSYLDVKAKINDGKTVIIEMQVLNVSSFAKRVIYNAAKTYATQ